MKKKLLFAFVGAIALSGAVGITSCSSDKDVAEVVNPSYDPESNSVVVDVALNISTSNSPSASTRMSSAATQATTDDNFRGISDARLMAITQTDNGKHLAAPTTVSKRFDLSQLVTTTQISATNSRRVLEMSLPLKTNTLVFYGRATKPTSGESTELSANDSYGSFVSNSLNNTTTNLDEVKFTVAQRLQSEKLEEYRKVEKLLSGILSCIMNTNLSGVTSDVSATDKAGDNAYVFDLSADAIKNIKWSDYANTTGKSPYTPTADQYALEDQLRQIYIQTTTIRGENGELRAASGEALLQTITDLWSAVNKVRCAQPFCIEEAVAKKLASEIAAEIKQYFSPQSEPGNGLAVTGVSFGDNLGTIISNFLNDKYWPINEALTANAAYKRADFGLAGLATDLASFPVSYGIPRGASHVKFGIDTDNDGTIDHPIFFYPENFNSSGMGGASFTVNDYLYSPELSYFGNSSLRVSDTPHATTEYPNGANDNAPTANAVGGWNNPNSWSDDWNQNFVTSASRSVAMKNDINYGTALLKTTVKLGATTLRDNRHAVQKSYNSSITDEKSGDEYITEPDNSITVNDNSFELIGVIVGGQTRNVGWNFLPKKVGTTPAYEYGYVTDNAIPDNAKGVTTSGSGPNYTLLFDNYKEVTSGDEQAGQEAVYVALEFRNNSGTDFYGNYNLIREGGTFYLIGVLDPNATSNLTGINWDSSEMDKYLAYHALPPYDNDGSTKKISRVFIQDFMTTANFVIGPKSLKYAYLTVPDLRSSSLSLGLSVDIKWETGLNFSDIVLGGN